MATLENSLDIPYQIKHKVTGWQQSHPQAFTQEKQKPKSTQIPKCHNSFPLNSHKLEATQMSRCFCTDLFKLCLFSLNFQMSLNSILTYPKVNTEHWKHYLVREHLSSQRYLPNSWSETCMHRPQINNSKVTVWGQGSLLPNCGNCQAAPTPAVHTGRH